MSSAADCFAGPVPMAHREGVEAYPEIKSVAFALKPAGDWLSLKG